MCKKTKRHVFKIFRSTCPLQIIFKIYGRDYYSSVYKCIYDAVFDSVIFVAVLISCIDENYFNSHTFGYIFLSAYIVLL